MPGNSDGRGPEVLICGVAGSGKTTYAQRVETQGYVCLSIDEEVRQRFGRYGLELLERYLSGFQAPSGEGEEESLPPSV